MRPSSSPTRWAQPVLPLRSSDLMVVPCRRPPLSLSHLRPLLLRRHAVRRPDPVGCYVSSPAQAIQLLTDSVRCDPNCIAYLDICSLFGLRSCLRVECFLIRLLHCSFQSWNWGNNFFLKFEMAPKRECWCRNPVSADYNGNGVDFNGNMNIISTKSVKAWLYSLNVEFLWILDLTLSRIMYVQCTEH